MIYTCQKSCTSLPYISAHLRLSPLISALSAHLRSSPLISAPLRSSPLISAHLRLSPLISAYLRYLRYLRLSPLISYMGNLLGESSDLLTQETKIP